MDAARQHVFIRVELLPGFKFTGKMVKKIKFTGKIGKTVKNGKNENFKNTVFNTCCLM